MGRIGSVEYLDLVALFFKWPSTSSCVAPASGSPAKKWPQRAARWKNNGFFALRSNVTPVQKVVSMMAARHGLGGLGGLG